MVKEKGEVMEPIIAFIFVVIFVVWIACGGLSANSKGT
jgi:hypothetical protein